MGKFSLEDILADAEESLKRHPAPDALYFVIEGVNASARDLLNEMRQGTPGGKDFLEEWGKMMADREKTES